MRLKKEILKKYSKGPLSRIIYLNLSNLEIDIIERLDKCEYLHWFIARNNNFHSDEGIEKLQQLWHLDLSNNKIDFLLGIDSFLALGTLILSNNDLKWSDLQRFRHAHIMSLSLHGNPQLDSDPYYRIHVIDSLPLIWELDGRLVTVTERLHVKQFFVDTQYTEHPVRHKMVSHPFRTSAMKNIGTEGIVTDECKYIFSKFPVSETHTKHTDERRFAYLTRMIQEDINRFLFEQALKTKLSTDFLETLMEERPTNVERFNMVLLFLVISLEFQLPTTLVRSVLVSAQLDMIGSISIMPYFLLPREFRTRVIGVLLNAAKVDRDNKMHHEGGLYAQLFMCLYYTVAQLTRISQTSHSNMQKVKPIPHNSDYMALMTSEVVSLMLRSTQFLNLITIEHGVVALISAATGNHDIVYTVQQKLLEFDQGLIGKSFQDFNEELNGMVLQAIEQRLSKINIKMADIPIGDRYLALSDSLPIKPLHSVIWASDYLSLGQTIPRTNPPILNPEREAAKPKPLQPKMGEKVLLGPQVVGELAMLMEGEIAMVKIDAVPVANGAVVSKLKSTDAHFAFVDMKSMCYAHDIRMWRPLKTTGDKVIDEPRYTIHSTDSRVSQGIKQSASTQKVDPDTSPLIYTPRERQQFKLSPEKARENKKALSASTVRTRSSGAGSANKNRNVNFSFSNKEFNELFPDEKANKIKPAYVSEFPGKSNTPEENGKKVTCSIVNCDSLHANDNVHYIRGLTPREDSSRSCSVVPTFSDRRHNSEISIPSRSIIPTATSEKDIKLPNALEEQDRKPVVDEQKDETAKSKSLEIALNVTDNTSDESPYSQRQEDAEKLKLPVEETMPPSTRSSPSGAGTHRHESDNLVADTNPLSETVFDDDCPICIANRQGTIFKAVNGEVDVTNTETPLKTVELPLPFSSPFEKQSENIENESYLCEKNADQENIKNDELMLNQTPEVKGRPKSSLPYGGVRLRLGDGQQPHQISRPKSAAESYSYFVITNSSNVIAKGTKAMMNDRNSLNGQSFFKTDFQQEREEAWKRTTRARRPQTAGVMTSSHIPPPQRPSSPLYKREHYPKTSRFKITRTDRWLGGGKDLYWDSVRKRPKSGHVPGWKEGLPASMRKKQRPGTAYSMPVTRMNISRPGSAMYAPVCSSCSPTSYGYPSGGQAAFMRGEEEERMYMMPQAQAIRNPADIQPRVLTSPVSDEEQTFLHYVSPKEEGLHIQGLPPYTVPHPRTFSYLPNDTDMYFFESGFSDDYHGMENTSKYHLSAREELRCNTPNHLNGDSCPPPSPRADEGHLWKTDCISDEPNITISYSSSAVNTDYKLCPFHEKMFTKSNGHVIIYVIESDALQPITSFDY